MGSLIVLACGSRDWTDREEVAWHLSRYYWDRPALEVIHGDAAGADRLAAEVAAQFGYAVRAFPADWKQFGKRAGILRNLAMLDENPDLVIAFQRNGSRGTQHTITEARRRGIPVEVHRA